jgi:FkbM family methyltransferase
LLKEKYIENMDYFAFQKFSQKKLPEIHFNESFADSFEKNFEKFESIFLRLGDDLSKKIYSKLINFRLSQDISFLEGFIDKQEFQYFDFILQNCADLKNFVDIGSYDGTNSDAFMKCYPNFEKIIAVEPNVKNYELTKNRLGDVNGLELHQIVLGSSDSIVEFKGDGTTGGIVSEGGMQVQMKTLDEICRNLCTPTMIKMDVEGGEKNVIEGGKHVIKFLAPVLAISGYHKSDDLWEIPEVVLSLNESYNVYLRHYTETIYETVFYFIPKEMF